jgi:hypothetical protein
MGGGDVAHVEGWILPQPDDVDIRKVQIDGITEMRVIAPHTLDGQRLRARNDTPLPERQIVGRVVPQLMQPRACASSARRNVLSASMLTDPIGSIWNATFMICLPRPDQP